jgi:hypothetical protein
MKPGVGGQAAVVFEASPQVCLLVNLIYAIDLYIFLALNLYQHFQ